MRKQIVYFSDDNEPFDTEEEALARDEAIKQNDTIIAWLEKAEIKGKKVPEYSKVITNFLAFAAGK